ncbi:hypothetical protein ACIQVA_31200 [Streptomyces microflavus]|uniref:hypothetical protein n=1 Tax=Streptomyces microflavus TaxID=1919 RepID=UPI00382C8EB8
MVFRSSGQNLTTAGTCIEMISRLLEPALLALGVLAIRGRIERWPAVRACTASRAPELHNNPRPP